MKKHVFWWLAHGKPTKNTCIYQLLDEKDVKPLCFHGLLPDSTLGPAVVELWLVTDYKIYFFLPAPPGKPKTISWSSVLMYCSMNILENSMAHGKPTKNIRINQLLDEKDVKPLCFHRLLHENATKIPRFSDFCMQKRMKRNVFTDFCLIRRWDQPLWSYDWSQIIKFIFFAGAPWKTDSNIVIGHRL